METITQHEFICNILERVLNEDTALIEEAGYYSQLMADCIYFISYYLLRQNQPQFKPPVISWTCQQTLLKFFRDEACLQFGSGMEKYLLGV